MSVERGDVITVVSGLPRSGTSLMMQMLVAGGLDPLVDDLRPADASNARGYFEFGPVAELRSDDSWDAQARGRVVKVVVPLVTALPPGERYRVIVMCRSISRMIASQRAMLERLGKPGAALPDEQLARVFGAQLDHACQAMDESSSFTLLRVDFDGLVDQPRSEVDRLAAFLDEEDGRRLDREAMMEVVDPSLRHHQS